MSRPDWPIWAECALFWWGVHNSFTVKTDDLYSVVVVSIHFSHASLTNFSMTIFAFSWSWRLQCGGSSCARAHCVHCLQTGGDGGASVPGCWLCACDVFAKPTTSPICWVRLRRYHAITGARTTLGSRNFAVAGAKMWNSLPVDLRLLSQSLPTFGHKLKHYLWNVSEPRAHLRLFKFALYKFSHYYCYYYYWIMRPWLMLLTGSSSRSWSPSRVWTAKSWNAAQISW